MSIKNWYPYKLRTQFNNSYCLWINLKGVPFRHPFFEETLSRGRSINMNSSFFHPTSMLNVLPDWNKAITPTSPSAFIFHVSRCGSTLLSQLFSLDEKIISLAEVPFFDEIIRLKFKQEASSNCSTEELLKSAIAIYGQKRTEKEEHLVIKTDSWHIFFYKLIRSLYPEVPFILLYRKPDEVIRSHRKLRGMQAVPGIIEPEVFGFTSAEIEGVGLDEYMIRVLESYYLTYLEVAKTDSNVLLLNYSEGAVALLEKTLSFSGIIITEDVKTQMIQRSSYHSKHPEKVFDETQKQETIPDYMRTAFELYNQIEDLRSKQLSQWL